MTEFIMQLDTDIKIVLFFITLFSALWIITIILVREEIRREKFLNNLTK